MFLLLSLKLLMNHLSNTVDIYVFREYVSSRVINKVIQIHDKIFCCMAGSLADAQAVTNAVIHQLSFHR